jgi:hypothetical protein
MAEGFNAVQIDDATPVIGGVQPAAITAAPSIQYISLYGANFGPVGGSVVICTNNSNPCQASSAVQVASSPQSYPYYYWSDNLVNIPVNTSSSASGIYYVQLTSGGESPVSLGGSGFLPGPQGESTPQSNFGQFEVLPSAPVVTISGGPGVPLNGSSTFSVQVSPSNNTAPIDLIITTAPGTTGGAEFAGGGTVMTITESTTVTILGTTVSSTANNITLGAVATLASAHFSVVWVTISFSAPTLAALAMPPPPAQPATLSPPLSSDTVGPFYLAQANPMSLGPVIFTNSSTGSQGCQVGVELVGAIAPTNYTGPVTLQRAYGTPQGEVYVNGVAPQGTNPFTGPDTSFSPYLAITPDSNGQVYDIDAPGVGVPENGNIYSVRQNFVEFAVLGNYPRNLPPGVSLPSPLPIASAYFLWWAASSCTNVNSTSVDIQFYTQIAGDNTAGAGTTKTTYNLK